MPEPILRLSRFFLARRILEMGEARGGPPPFDTRDRSAFLGGLDRIIQSIKRKTAG